MKAKISEVFQQIKLSPIVAISERAKELALNYEKKTGSPFIYFQRGEVGFETPKYVLDAISDAALVKKLTKYPKSGGEAWLKDTVIESLARDRINGIGRENILCTNGGQEGLELLFRLFEGARVASFGPIWCGMLEAILPYAKCDLQLLPLEESDGHLKLNEQTLENALKDADILYINTPHNPTGKVFSAEELEKINQLCKKYGVIVAADEAYKDIVFEGKHKSMLEFSGEHIVSVFTGSKTFAITGLRAGYIVSRNQQIINYLTKGQQAQCAGVAPIVQYALKTALEKTVEKEQWLEGFVKELRARRDIIVDELKDLFPDIYKPEGAFYFFIDLNKHIPAEANDKDKYLLDTLINNGIAVVHGSAFGKGYEGHIRISYSTVSQELVREGAKRFKEVLK